MSTRSAIALSTDTGVQVIYCHHDGYIGHNGALLQENYTRVEDVRELMELGDLSSLAFEPESCEAYHRDRHEPRAQTKARVYKDFETALAEEFENSDREYFYVFLKNGTWAVIESRTADTKGAQKLSEAVAEERRSNMHSL